MRDLIKKANKNIAENFSFALKYSFTLATYFAVVYIIARLTGLHRITELRFINYILFFPVAWTALKKLYASQNNYIEYFNGLLVSCMICMLGQLWFGILFGIYLLFDPSFYNFLLSELPQPLFYPRLSILFIQITEGMAASVVLSLMLMQYFKRKQGRWAFAAR